MWKCNLVIFPTHDTVSLWYYELSYTQCYITDLLFDSLTARRSHRVITGLGCFSVNNVDWMQCGFSEDSSRIFQVIWKFVLSCEQLFFIQADYRKSKKM